MNALLASAPLLLTQHVLLHLPCRGLGQVAKLYGSRALEVRQALAAEGDDLLFGYPLPWLQGDEHPWDVRPTSRLVWQRQHTPGQQHAGR